MKLLLVDKHEIFRESLSRLLIEKLEVEVMATSSSAPEAIEEVRRLEPDLMLVDIDLPLERYIQLFKYATEILPQIGIIILTHSEEDSHMLSTLRAGAKGYVSKDSTVDDLLKAIVLVAEGGVYISPQMATKLLTQLSLFEQARKKELTKTETRLSQREKEVLHLIAAGRKNKEIAEALFISEHTVKVHLRNIMEKLDVHSRLEAVLISKENLPQDTENSERAP